MAKKIGSALNFQKNEIQNARVQNLSSAPSSPVTGQIYFDTTLFQFGVYDGSTWVYFTDAEVEDAINDGETSKAPSQNAVFDALALKVPTSYLDTDGTLAANSDSKVATQKATKTYADTKVPSSYLDTDGTLAANSDSKIATQKATKTYIDAVAQGLKWKAPVRVATTVAGTLASSFENGDTVDGVTLATNDRILLKNQASADENGIYIVAASGAPARASDADTAAELLGMVVDVLEGTANADTAWILTNNSVTLGVTLLAYSDFVKANVPAATTSVQGKVYLATAAEAEAKSDSNKAVTPAALANFARIAVFTITADSSTTDFPCTHNFSTRNVLVQVREAQSPYGDIIVDSEANSTSQVTIKFATAPTTGTDYKVMVVAL